MSSGHRAEDGWIRERTHDGELPPARTSDTRELHLLKGPTGKFFLVGPAVFNDDRGVVGLTETTTQIVTSRELEEQLKRLRQEIAEAKANTQNTVKPTERKRRWPFGKRR